jgi:glycosyltransferase involved in cell wall biosynthesis
MFSIIIPTLNNVKYLMLCIKSIYKNSKYKHEIIPHVNIGDDGTTEFLKKENIKFTYTEENSGICKGVNLAAKISTNDYILYAHDDFYFCPNWDEILKLEIDKIGHNNFYLSGTMMYNGQIKFNCGDTLENFDENKFLSDYKNFNYYDFQGSTWAPHLIHKNLWNKVGGFSEEFYPGTGSDPDLNMKLFKEGIKIFKGINDFKVYHFGSIVTRKYKDNKNIRTETGSRGDKIFLLKWGFSIKFFKRFLIESDTLYQGPLKGTNKNLVYYSHFLLNKLYYLYIRYIYNFRNKHKLL